MIAPPFRSAKVTGHAKGQPCTLRLPGVCAFDSETTVFAHIRDRHKGMGQKASDHSGVFACWKCHLYIDEWHGTQPQFSDAFLAECIISALQETWSILIRDGVIGFPHDAPRQRKVKPRKPREARATINSGRKIQSRPFPKRNP